MTLWDRIRNAALQITPWSRGDFGIRVMGRSGGINVTPEVAQTFSAISACVRVLSETVASLPWPVFRRQATGRESLPTHPVAWLLNYQPNPEQTAFALKRQLLSHWALWGNGYAEIERGMDGRALWLWPLLPDRTHIARSETGALVAIVNGGGQQYAIPRENLYHLSDGSFDGVMGLSRVQLARRAIGAGIAQDEFSSSYYANGASLGGVIEQKSGKTLSAEAKDLLLQEFNTKYAGPSRAGKTLYIDGGMEYKPIPSPDVEHVASRRFSVEEVCRWYGVPQHLVQMLTESNYAISFTADKNFVEHTLRPIATMMEQEANIRLFGSRAQGSVYSRMNLNGLMRADPNTRGQYYRWLVNSGVMSINEVRELEELNSIGPDGDEHYLQINMTTLSSIADGENLTPKATAPAAPQQADAPPTQQTDNVIRREALEWWSKQQEEANA